MAAYIRQRPPRWFWLTGFAATLWGLLGVFAFLLYAAYGAILFPAPADPLSDALPTWFGIVYACTAGSALLGGIALMTRSALARLLFLASLAFLLVQSAYLLLGTPVVPQFGWSTLLVPLLLIAVAGGEIWFADYARRHGWIC
ncbi:hypothetical protein [Sphingosinithalassobacter sp. LHW66-3]|uniref:hypothetical protein n=1 Tax=Sphingosinithalassobacter sp. LHW66-3 TaxID=3424718 RepID=UPI003D6B07D3